MILKNEEYLDIIADITEECSQWGKLLQVIIPRRGQDKCGFNRVFLQYEKQTNADKCFQKTHDRIFDFDNKKIKCHYYNETLFKNGEWDQNPLPL